MNRLFFAALAGLFLLVGCKPPAPEAVVPEASEAASEAPSWEIGEDIAGKTVVIDGKEVEIPDDVAETKRKMDEVAREKTEEMDALQKERLERFQDPDMKP